MMLGRKRSQAGASLDVDEEAPAKEAIDHCDEDPTSRDESSSTDDGMNGAVQEVMKDNLELMREVVMRIREDEEFAKNIYADCPRLQHLLDQHPDLRPVFEDPRLVRINFEQVYRDAGGVLPEDPPKKQSIISKIVNHPLFKVVKFLLLIKKLVNCIMGGGFSMIRGCFQGCVGGLCVDDAADLVEGGEGAEDMDGDMDGDHPEFNPANAANKEALNNAADHMEEPEVQERMQEILEQDDPEALDEAIENDKELNALRESNPLCAELMSDPETMKILVEPDNLRALGDAPDLIEQDFIDPNWQAPDIETGADVNTGVANVEGGGLETVPEGDFDAEADEFDEENPSEEEGDEEEEEEGGLEEFEMGEDDNDGRGNTASKSKGQQKKGDKQKSQNGGGGGFMANLGAGVTDYLAGELVGFTAGEIMGGDEFGGLEDVEDLPVEDVAGAAEAADAVAATDLFTSDGMDNLQDAAENLEDTAEDAEGTAAGGDSKDGGRHGKRTAAFAGTGAVVGGGIGAARGNRNRGDEDLEDGSHYDDDSEDEFEDDEEEPAKKSRFGIIGKAVAAISTAAKEHVATAILGDDFGEALVEKIEEDDEDKEGKDGEEKKSEGEEDETEEKRKRRGLFRRKR